LSSGSRFHDHHEEQIVEESKRTTAVMNRRVTRVLFFILLGATACGDASITASSNFRREGQDDRGATVRIEAEETSPAEGENGRR
jgi:hypothetical protein